MGTVSQIAKGNNSSLGGKNMFDFDKNIPLQTRENDLLTIGELLIDLISQDYDATNSNVYHRYFGGSCSNIAMNIKKLGVNVQVIGAVGKDPFGMFLLDQLSQSSIDTTTIQQVEESTSLVVVNKSKGTPHPIFYRGADFHITYSSMLEQALLNSRILHFSCWPISKEPARLTIEQVLQKAKEHNLLIGFDPNYHPLIWQGGHDGVKYIKSILSHVDIVKPSRDDAERLFGYDRDEKQIEKFLSLGAKLVILTLGKDGLLVSNGKETLHFDSLANEIIDTTGAGDAFWSGFYAAILRGYPIQDAIKFGLASSAYKLKFVGAVVDFPSFETLKELYHIGGNHIGSKK